MEQNVLRMLDGMILLAECTRQNREEEEAMARSIDVKWNKIVDQSLPEEGVRTA